MTTSFQRALQAGDRALIACKDLPELHASVERAMQTLVATHLVCQSLTPQPEPVMCRHEFEDDTPPDPSRTFGPPPYAEAPTKRDVFLLRAVALATVVFWLAVGSAVLLCWPK